MATTQNTGFSNTQRVDNSTVRGRIWSKFELIRYVTDVLVTSKGRLESTGAPVGRLFSILLKFGLLKDLFQFIPIKSCISGIVMKQTSICVGQ